VVTRERTFASRVVGVIESDDPEAAFRACVAALEGGIGTIEVSTSVPSCLDIVRGLVASTGGTLPLGVGAVWDPDAVVGARQAGAAFVSTAVVLPDVARACRSEDILCVMGALTPTEIHRAREAGADVVHLFPIQAVGGPDYLRWLQGPLAGVPFWVSGGVEIDQIEEYLALGAVAVGLTTALFPPELVRRGDASLITTLARRAAAVAEPAWA
jgi:2-dehydro-3-deoxyphosphogluconate aldolase/(4S)-4-hydroxy-2-oxoglutarate aldolase